MTTAIDTLIGFLLAVGLMAALFVGFSWGLESAANDCRSLGVYKLSGEVFKCELQE